MTPSFAHCVIRWQKKHGRHGLPWQNTRDAYPIWLSEIMLQQTQVSTVIPYYSRFLERFPDIKTLAGAKPETVMQYWSGLGYYSRARNLHAAARLIVEQYGSHFPKTPEEIQTLPGVGRSTAGAIAVFAFGKRAPILDGNVRRVFLRYFGIEGSPAAPEITELLWEKAEKLLPVKDIIAYTQGLMDLGATLCTRKQPVCMKCPLVAKCVAHKTRRTHLLPSPKKTKKNPVKKTVMLMLKQDNKFLFEKRPSKGIWGGLYSFPEMQTRSNIAKHCAKELDLKISDKQALAEFAHAFSHYTLRIQPVVCETMGSPRVDESYRWMTVKTALKTGIPAPVRNLLTTS